MTNPQSQQQHEERDTQHKGQPGASGAGDSAERAGTQDRHGADGGPDKWRETQNAPPAGSADSMDDEDAGMEKESSSSPGIGNAANKRSGEAGSNKSRPDQAQKQPGSDKGGCGCG